MSNSDLENYQPQLPPAVRDQPSVGDMLSAVIAKGVTAENVGAVAEIVKLYQIVEANQAEKAFAKAFVDLQSEMQNVKATRAVPNNDGTTRYNFAPFEDIMREVGPLLKKHGFTVTFSTDYAENRLVKICTMQHIGGHSKSNRFSVRVGQGPPKASECQADGAASTYAKRFALCDALNIICDKDTDARAEGAEITSAQAADLERRVVATKADRVKFLAFAGAATFAEITVGKYPLLDGYLKKKEQSK